MGLWQHMKRQTLLEETKLSIGQYSDRLLLKT